MHQLDQRVEDGIVLPAAPHHLTQRAHRAFSVAEGEEHHPEVVEGA